MTETRGEPLLPLFPRPAHERFNIDETKAKGAAQQVLSVLADGLWHTTREMLQASTHRFACGIQTLREEGYEIETRANGKATFNYRLAGKTTVVKTTATLEAAYFATPHWRAMRAKRLDHDNATCCNCKRRTDQRVHHWRYDLYHERLGDLMTLCVNCHARMHDNQAIKLAFPKSLPKSIAERIRADNDTSSGDGQ